MNSVRGRFPIGARGPVSGGGNGAGSEMSLLASPESVSVEQTLLRPCSYGSREWHFVTVGQIGRQPVARRGNSRVGAALGTHCPALQPTTAER